MNSNTKFQASVEIMQDGSVYVHSKVLGMNLDRNETFSWSLSKGEKNEALARRLVAAVNAGVVFIPVRVGTDINRKTYLIVQSNVCGRTMNADLKRLGF